MDRMALDIMGPLPLSSSGNKYILVVEDYFTKWTEAFALPDQEAITIARVMVDDVFSRWGVPMYLHSDQGKNFESVLFKEVCKVLGIEKTRTTPYHPQSDGLVERQNRTIEFMLSHYVNSRQNDWDIHLQQVILSYRSSVHESTGFTPHYLWTGREVRLPLDVTLGGEIQTPRGDIGEFAWELKKALHNSYALCNKHLRRAHSAQQTSYNRKQKAEIYEVNDHVGILFPQVKVGCTKKLYKPWKGPYVIIQKLNDLNYKVKLLNSTKSSFVVHINRMMHWPSKRTLQVPDHLIADGNLEGNRRSGRKRKKPVRFTAGE